MEETTVSPEPKPKRAGIVTAILGSWLKESNPDLTPDERARAKHFCRAKLRDARASYGRTPPIDVLLDIDEATSLQILSHRALASMLRKTSPLCDSEESPSHAGADAKQGEAAGKAVKAAPARGRTSEQDALHKTVEQARKARRELDTLIHGESKTKSSQCIPPDVLSMVTEYDDVIREVFALGIERNAAYTGPPEPGDPIRLSDMTEFTP